MKITRFCATDDGGSRFEDLEITLANEREDGMGHTISFSTPFSSPNVSLVTLPAGLDQDWNGAPERQLVFVLQGCVEVETTDGNKRRWHKGQFFLADDTSGQGHQTRTINGPALVLFNPVSAEFAVERWTQAVE